MSEHFSVYQFFNDGTHERVAELVDMETAVDKLAHFSNSVAAKIGVVTKVIMTDGGDDTCFVWENGKGVTFPPECTHLDLSRRKTT